LESNWRWNVWEMGLDPRVVGLAARLLPFPTAFGIGVWTPNHAYAVQLSVNPSTGFWEPGAPFQAPWMIGHFPWGLNVLPD
jgi:hypothetical protein